jgi:hypothetical protein
MDRLLVTAHPAHIESMPRRGRMLFSLNRRVFRAMAALIIVGAPLVLSTQSAPAAEASPSELCRQVADAALAGAATDQQVNDACVTAASDIRRLSISPSAAAAGITCYVYSATPWSGTTVVYHHVGFGGWVTCDTSVGISVFSSLDFRSDTYSRGAWLSIDEDNDDCTGTFCLAGGGYPCHPLMQDASAAFRSVVSVVVVATDGRIGQVQGLPSPTNTGRNVCPSVP